MFLQIALLIPCFEEKTYHLHKLCIRKDDQKIETFAVFVVFDERR